MIDKSSQNRPRNKYSLNVDGHDALDMANDINDYFSKIATDDTYDLDSIQEAIANYTHVSADHSTCTLNNFEVCKMLMSIKKTSSGPDDIPYWLLRECAIEIAPIVTFIFNKSLSLGKIPSAWKTAIITPLPKKKCSSISENFSNLRPISVTSILSRLLEKVIIQRFLWPGLCEEGCLEDQFGFRPTGSTTAALIDITNFIYSKFNEGSDYVRCLLIDYSRAFDTVDHSILFQELRALNLPLKIYNWIADFLTGRSQCVKLQSIRSALAAISRSVVQGSRIGPYLYILLVRKLKTISFHNKIDKYADDTTLLVPQHSDISIETEFAHVQEWSQNNKLVINTSKTKEIIFWRSKKASSKYNLPLLNNIQRVNHVVLLGVTLESNLGWSIHINNILSQAMQRFYLLRQLKFMSMSGDALDNVFASLVLSRITYALPVFAHNLSKDDTNKINALLRKSQKWGVNSKSYNLFELSEQANIQLSIKMLSPGHCLHHLIPPIRPPPSYALRPNVHQFNTPQIKFDKLKNSFIHRIFT